MLQKESALRLTAKPDTKLRYPLGICIEAMGHAEIIRNVGRECFRPVPDVDSAVTEIVIDKNFETACDSSWSELLHKAFAHRRKTLANNLKGYIDTGELGKKRAEDLTINEWLKIYSSV